MKIIKLRETRSGYSLDSSAYGAYVESVKQLLPPALYEFMSEPWHYDPSDRRCLHDARLHTLTVEEYEKEERTLNNITIILAGAYGNTLKLHYYNTSSYSIEKNTTAWPANHSTHGDLIIDEVIILEPTNTFQHEIRFEDATIKIVFEDFLYLTETTNDQANSQ